MHQLSHRTIIKPNGFALISTISLMAIILMISLGTVQLSKSSAKESKLAIYKLQAQQNARLALQIAMAELQIELGPDQRISANMGIMAGNPKAKDFDGRLDDDDYAHPHLLGSWNAWTTWLSGDNSASEIKSTYDRGRTENFRRLLVSHPSAAEFTPEQWMRFARQGDDIPTMDLVSKIAGEENVSSPSLKAPIISLPTGGYAWAVSGENQKAPLHIGEKKSDESLATNSANLSNLSRHGLDANLNPLFTDYPTDDTELSRIISLNSAGMFSKGRESMMREYFHDYSTVSKSLLTNVRKGGLKKDLNLFLERENAYELMDKGTPIRPRPANRFLPTPYDSEPRPVRPLDGYLGNSDLSELTMHIPSWRQIYNYYREYKQPQNPQSVTAAINPYHTGTSGITKCPLIANITYQIGRVILPDNDGDGIDDCYITYDPVVTIWNPYNISIQSPRSELTSRVSSLEMRIFGGDVEIHAPKLNEWLTVFRSRENKHMGENSVKIRSFIPAVTLKPGETRVYSYSPEQSSSSGGYVSKDFSAGYNTVNPNSYGGLAVKIDPTEDIVDEDSGEVTGTMRLLEGVSLAGARIELRFGDQTSNDTKTGFSFDLKGEDISPSSYQSYNNITLADPRLITHTGVTHISDQLPLNPGGAPMDTSGRMIQFGYALKGADASIEHHSITGVDYTNKSFVHSNPTNKIWHQGAANDRTRKIGQYAFFYNLSPSGTGLIDLDAANPQRARVFAPLINTSAPLVEIPTSPIYSLASLHTMGIQLGAETQYSSANWAIVRSNFAEAHPTMLSSSNVGLPIANSFAHPGIAPNNIYGNLIDMHDADYLKTALNDRWYTAQALSDYYALVQSSKHIYDYSFLLNDALFDDWYCSSITPQTSTLHFTPPRDLPQVISSFAIKHEKLPNSHIVFEGNQETAATMADNLLSGSEPSENAYLEAAKYLMVNGGFNVNSTSAKAWEALFNGIKATTLTTRNIETGHLEQQTSDGVVITRFSVSTNSQEGANSADPNSWQGIRYLTKGQISKLAQECVRQVKLRGPFLNMSDFVNRRLDDNNPELSRCGALQAAIDWDEFNGNSVNVNNPESINARFKDEMVATPPVDSSPASSAKVQGGGPEPFREAHQGSRWTGIPGYVMQSDILKRIGNQISVRDDTFTIRAYGKSQNDKGKLMSEAYCEAIVQRGIHYTKSDRDAPNAKTDELVEDLNIVYGRKINIISFRWVNAKDI